MTLIFKIKDKIDSALGYFTGLILFTMAVLIIASVLSRILGGSLGWTTEVVRAGVVWTTFLGSYVAIARNKDIKVDMFVTRMPLKTQVIFGFLSDALILFFLYFFTLVSFIFMDKFKTYTLPMTGISRGVLYSVFPIGSVMMSLHYILNVIYRIISLKNNDPDAAVKGIGAVSFKKLAGKEA